MRFFVLLFALAFSGCVISVPQTADEALHSVTKFQEGIAVVQGGSVLLYSEDLQEVGGIGEDAIAVEWVSSQDGVIVQQKVGDEYVLTLFTEDDDRVLYRTDAQIQRMQLMETADGLVFIESGDLFFLDITTGAATRIVEHVFEFSVSNHDRKIWYQSDNTQAVVSINVSGGIQEVSLMEFAPAFHAPTFINKNRLIGFFIEDNQASLTSVHITQEEVEESYPIEFTQLPSSVYTSASPNNTYFVLEYVSEDEPNGYIHIYDMDEFELVDAFEGSTLTWLTDSSYVFEKKSGQFYEIFQKNSILGESTPLLTEAQDYTIITP